jgi:hypothetical protein
MLVMKLCAVRFCRKLSGDGVLVALGLQRGSEREAFSGEWRWRHPSFRLLSDAARNGLEINTFRAPGRLLGCTSVRCKYSNSGAIE